MNVLPASMMSHFVLAKFKIAAEVFEEEVDISVKFVMAILAQYFLTFVTNMLMYFLVKLNDILFLNFKFKEVANVTITEENSLDVVEQLENLTMEEEMNSGDTKVTIEILIKIVENENLLPQNKTKRQQLGQVSRV